MKPHHKLLMELISLTEKYQNEMNDDGMMLEDFILWLNRTVLLKSLSPAVYHDDDINNIRLHTDSNVGAEEEFVAKRANVQLTILLHQLSKHFKIYSKKILVDTDLVSMDGHMFLSSLYHTESMTKAKLISSNYMELPSGIEVIRRLLKKGFIEEYADPNDKRSKRVKISQLGKKEYEASLPGFRKVINIMAGKLPDEKIMNLIVTLNELNEYHKSIHSNAKTESLDGLLDRIGDVH